MTEFTVGTWKAFTLGGVAIFGKIASQTAPAFTAPTAGTVNHYAVVGKLCGVGQTDVAHADCTGATATSVTLGACALVATVGNESYMKCNKKETWKYTFALAETDCTAGTETAKIIYNNNVYFNAPTAADSTKYVCDDLYADKTGIANPVIKFSVTGTDCSLTANVAAVACTGAVGAVYGSVGGCVVNGGVDTKVLKVSPTSMWLATYVSTDATCAATAFSGSITVITIGAFIASGSDSSQIYS